MIKGTVESGVFWLGPIELLQPSDSLFSSQWHLTDFGVNINVAGVWDEFTGFGVKVGVIDDGVQYIHPDLSKNYDTGLDHDARDNDFDAAPTSSGDSHGTMVAGVIAAEANNEIGTVGVAFDATLVGFRMGFGAAWSTQQIVDSISLQTGVDVSNSSWMIDRYFFDDFNSAEFQPVDAALLDAVSNGREGLGTVFVFAAGNDGAQGGDANYHNFQNATETIAVGAIDSDGVASDFSTPGAPLLVVAPGSGIFTTAKIGSGLINGDWTWDSGTSFAAPIVSGVVA
ncbi:MAG: S8 family serine peptidase, partial [Rhodospirillales bacterium]|nr:S8 family serine peptidase [Rhodospirillales bacterium]